MMANEHPPEDGPAKKRVDEPTGTAFVGHEWDGIEELDTPMPDSVTLHPGPHVDATERKLHLTEKPIQNMSLDYTYANS